MEDPSVRADGRPLGPATSRIEARWRSGQVRAARAVALRSHRQLEQAGGDGVHVRAALVRQHGDRDPLLRQPAEDGPGAQVATGVTEGRDAVHKYLLHAE